MAVFTKSLFSGQFSRRRWRRYLRSPRSTVLSSLHTTRSTLLCPSPTRQLMESSNSHLAPQFLLVASPRNKVLSSLVHPDGYRLATSRRLSIPPILRIVSELSSMREIKRSRYMRIGCKGWRGKLRISSILRVGRPIVGLERLRAH